MIRLRGRDGSGAKNRKGSMRDGAQVHLLGMSNGHLAVLWPLEIEKKMVDALQSMGFLFQSRFMTKHYSQLRQVWERLILEEKPDETSKRNTMVTNNIAAICIAAK